MEVLTVAVDINLDEKSIGDIDVLDFCKLVRSLDGNVYISPSDLTEDELDTLDSVLVCSSTSLVSTVN